MTTSKIQQVERFKYWHFLERIRKMATLDDFVDTWKSISKVSETVEGLDRNKGDKDGFEQYWGDFSKRAQNDVGKKVLQGQKEVEGRLNLAAKYLRAKHDEAFEYSSRNIATIVGEAREKYDKDEFAGLIASLEPKTENPGYKGITDAVKKYRKVSELLQGTEEEKRKSRGHARPDVKKIKKELMKITEAELGNTEKAKRYIKLIEEFYDSRDEYALEGYQSLVIEPAREELQEALDKGDVKSYVKDNLAETKKDEQMGFYLALYEKLK